MTAQRTIPFFLLFLAIWFVKAQTATITGVVLDEHQKPLPNVNISSNENSTTSNVNGFYLLTIKADATNRIVFSHIGHRDVILKAVLLNTNEIFEFNPVMKIEAIQVDGVEVSAIGQKKAEGITTIPSSVVRRIPGANAGVENILKLLPGVSFNNELSTQYNVRGGNFDENLVYVNGIEVYRPFLIRSAQQEGLSFINSQMVRQVRFSAGGFQAKYGDKLSSVLDIAYKTPTKFGISIDASLLGGGATLETVSKKSTFSSITGVRYRTNALFVNSQQTATNVQPSFFDAQTYLTYILSKKVRLNFLGAFAINDYQNEPLNRQTNFGSLLEPRALLIAYEGNEQNRYQTILGGLQTEYQLNDDTTINLVASVYHATENEFSDVIASYELADVDTNLGSENLGMPINSRGLGSEINRARNELDALILNIAHRGKHSKNKKLLEWGLRYSHEDIRDRLREATFIDSAGFFVRPPDSGIINNQPEEPFEGDLIPFEGARATNFVTTDRLSGFLQWSHQTQWGTNNIYYNAGIRSQLWSVSGEGVALNTQILFSPRVQFAIKPNWEQDLLFRLAMGSYQQPAFYRELRDRNGTVNPQVKAQRSVHFVLGNEYSFNLWNRPFKLVSETYYKNLTNVNTYTVEDVRVRYVADNNADAYVYGIDFRLNGTFVPGAESWLSLGYLKTEENSDNRGYISRPTDQRLKFAVLFQDYVAAIPDLKLYLNLVYNTGLPGGSPSYADPYDFQNRLRDYRRADLGISYIFADIKKKYPEGHWLHSVNELSAGFEIFNLFNNQNSITNTWVRDVDTQNQFAVPNFLTSRVFNVKMSMRL